MHFNYHFLKHLSAELGQALSGSLVKECYSQNKNELVLVFQSSRTTNTFVIKALLDPKIAVIGFPDTVSRARKNSTTLFPEIIERSVVGVYQFLNERCFQIELESDYKLLFKLHGNRSNILLLQHSNVIGLFNSNLAKDWRLDVSQLDRPLDQSMDNFKANGFNVKKVFPTFGKEVQEFLDQHDWDKSDDNKRITLIEQVQYLLKRGSFYINRDTEGRPFLTLLETNGSHELSAISAANTIYHLLTKYHFVEREKVNMLRTWTNREKKTKNYIEKAENKLQEIANKRPFEEIANIIMANLHSIPSGTSQIELDDFYTNRRIEIKLNPKLSAQQFAENLYRKSKNASREKETIQQNIESKKKELINILQEIKVVQELHSPGDIKRMKKSSDSVDHSLETLPYWSKEYKGFKILIGKNAKHNDELTLKIAKKNDLWLHAKDSAGSHVVIKENPGKGYPKDVLEKAAEVAAFYSKRKNDTLCPVIYTEKKFVRKRKGFKEGQVVVEREKVLLVVPQDTL